jgi:hypothetical protein
MKLKDCMAELQAATRLNSEAAEKMVRFSSETFGGYNLGFCIQQIDNAKRRMMIQETEEEEERLCKLNPPFWKR